MIKILKFDDESALSHWFRTMGAVKVTMFDTFVENNEIHFVIEVDLPELHMQDDNILISVAGNNILRGGK